MEIPAHIKSFAAAEDFPDVRFIGDWKGKAVYAASSPDEPFVGLPQYILAEGEKARWASPSDTEAIMQQVNS